MHQAHVGMVAYVISACVGCVTKPARGFMGALEDIARFTFILFGIIPMLACTFVVLGIFFHIPRIVATHACRPLVWFCLKHIMHRSSQKKMARQRCRWVWGGCCLTCRAAAQVISGEVVKRGCIGFCCICRQSLQCR